MAALIAWMLVVRVDELVKDLRPPKAAALRAVLDKFINTNTEAVHAIKAAFSAISHIFAAQQPLQCPRPVIGQRPTAQEFKNMATKNTQKIGWIGMGRMGFPMAERLIKAGHDVTIWNRTRAKAEPLAK